MCITTISSPAITTPRHNESSCDEDDFSLPNLHLSDSLNDDEDDIVLLQPGSYGVKTYKNISIEFIWTKIVGFIGLLELLSCSLTYMGHETGLIIQHAVTIRQLCTLCLVIQATKDAAIKAYSSSILRKKKKRKKDRKKNPKITVRGRIKCASKKKHSGSYLIIVFLFNLLFRLAILPIFSMNGSVDHLAEKIDTSLLSGSYQKYSPSPHDNNAAYSILSYSLIEFIVLHLTVSIRSLLSEHIRNLTKMIVVRISKRAVSEAIKHPFLIHFHIQQVFTLIRWTKYLLPLLGACNKLKAHIVDGVTKFKQRQKKVRIEKSWDTVLQSMREKYQLERAVRHIQYEFRRRKEEKALRRLRYMQLTSSVQPRRAADVFTRIENKLKEQAKVARVGLAIAEEIEVSRLEKSVVTINDKLLMESHGMKVRAHRCYLIPPNTTFSVVWKCIAVSCLTLEFFNIAFTPYLINMERYSIYELVKMLFLFQASSSTCHNNAPTISGILFSFFNDFSGIQSKCACPLSTINIFAQIIAHHLVPTLSSVIISVRFLDVFLTFLTGEISPTGGTLVPKPFIKRWLIPGIGLQLIVNPSMYGIYSLLEASFLFVTDIGALKMAHLIYIISYLSPTTPWR